MKYDFVVLEKNDYNIDYTDIEDDEEDNKSDNNKVDKNDKTEEMSAPKRKVHLNRSETYIIINIIKNKLKDFPKLKRCCEVMDLTARDRYDDDGNYASPFDIYFADDPEKYFKVIEGDVWSGYPSFNSEGSDDYAEDKQKFVRAVNEELNEKGIKARFLSEGSGSSISFGLKSLKEK